MADLVLPSLALYVDVVRVRSPSLLLTSLKPPSSFLFTLCCAAEFGLERNGRDMRFADREALEVIVRVVSKTSLKRGRIVARQPAIIPAPGSMVDQMVQFAEFPTIN